MKFEAILFDCDGVLVDSEPITNGVLCAMLNEAGWALSSEECMRLFIGKTVRSEAARIEAHTGQPLTDAWMAEFYARRNVRLDAELRAIDGAVAAVQTVHAALGGRIACASGPTGSRWKCSCRRWAWRRTLPGAFSAATKCRPPSPRPTCTWPLPPPWGAACALPGGGRHGDRRDCRGGRGRHCGGLQPVARGARHAEALRAAGAAG